MRPAVDARHRTHPFVDTRNAAAVPWCARGLIVRLWLLCLCLFLPTSPLKAATNDGVTVEVTEPYMELRTGPGRGYHVTSIAERGETVQILKRQTGWFKVRTARGTEGWVSLDQIEKSLMAEGVQDNVREAVLQDFLHQRWEAGFAAGVFDGDPAIAFRAGYHWIDNLVTEIGLTQVSGTYTSTQLASANLILQPYTDTRFSPLFTIGGGLFRNRNRASLVGNDNTISAAQANAGLGLRYYLTRNFVVRADYKKYVALTNVQKNDRFDEELIGISFFF